MQFAVPQFIETEAKIFPFLTVRQFIITLISGGLIFVVVYSGVSLIIMASLILLIVIIGGSLAFVKINGHLFHEFFGFMIGYIGKPAIRVWRKEPVTESTIAEIHKNKQEVDQDTKREIIAKRPIDRSNLSQLALVVDTGGAYKKEN